MVYVFLFVTVLVAGFEQSAYAQEGSVSGVVRNESGEALGDICVWVARLSDEEDGAGSAVTDSAGAYQVSGLDPGSYKLWFSDCRRERAIYLSEWYDDEPYFEVADPVSVSADAETSGIDAVLAAAAAITGTVTNEGGDPLEYVCVVVFDDADRWVAFTLTEEDGTYLADELPAGQHRVGFFDCGAGFATATPGRLPGCDDHVEYAGEWYDDKPDAESADRIAVEAGQTVSGADAELALLTARPDLAVALLEVTRQDDSAAGLRTIVVDVANHGEVESDGALVEVEVCGKTLGCSEVGETLLASLTPGEVSRVSLDWDPRETASAGDVTVTGRIHTGDDSDCSNNEASVDEDVLVSGTGAGITLLVR